VEAARFTARTMQIPAVFMYKLVALVMPAGIL
jgi:hypothetical protein